MANNSLISATLSPDDARAVVDAISTIKGKLPFLVGFTGAQRRRMPKMGDKSRAFVVKAREMATQNPNLLPVSFDRDEFQRDVALSEALLPIAQALTNLSELVSDTALAAGSDAYSAALTVYKVTKVTGQKAGVSDTITDLGKRFSRLSSRTPVESVAQTTPVAPTA